VDCGAIYDAKLDMICKYVYIYIPRCIIFTGINCLVFAVVLGGDFDSLSTVMKTSLKIGTRST
jgi:hypothetical protein